MPGHWVRYEAHWSDESTEDEHDGHPIGPGWTYRITNPDGSTRIIDKRWKTPEQVKNHLIKRFIPT